MIQQTNIGIKREKELLEIKNEELIKLLKGKDKEIERLNNALKEYDRGTYCKLINENHKLNNIINELEKEFDSVIKDPLIHMCYKRLARKYADKLQELKGSDKE